MRTEKKMEDTSLDEDECMTSEGNTGDVGNERTVGWGKKVN